MSYRHATNASPVSREQSSVAIAWKITISHKEHYSLHFANLHITVCYRACSHEVTAAIFVFQNNEAWPCWRTKKILWELNSFLILNAFFFQ